MGASGVGEIARLVRMARPDVGIVLKVGLAHAGEFGGIEQTVRGEVRDGHRPARRRDVAVLNADDPRVAPMADLTAARVVWFGLGDPTPTCAATDVARARARHRRSPCTLADGRVRAACASACSASTTS